MPSTKEINNHSYDTNFEIFLNKLCDYFASIGSLMSKNLSKQQNLDLKNILNVVVKFSFFTKLLRMKLMLILTISRLTQHQA